MSAAKLHVIMETPRWGNYEHWALHLEHGGEHVVYEVTDEHPNFRKNEIRSRPENWIRSFQVGTVNAQDLSIFRSEIVKAKVDNETVLWTCQDYVLEILQELVAECVIDEEDYDEVKEDILGHYGPK